MSPSEYGDDVETLESWEGFRGSREFLGVLSRVRSRGKELNEIECKRELKLESQHDKVELAKDVSAQANLSHGGSIVYGVLSDGTLIGLPLRPDWGRVENILVERLRSPPADLTIEPQKLLHKDRGDVWFLWIKVGPAPRGTLTGFVGKKGNVQFARRVGTSTRVLSEEEVTAFDRATKALPTGPEDGRYPRLYTSWDKLRENEKAYWSRQIADQMQLTAQYLRVPLGRLSDPDRVSIWFEQVVSGLYVGAGFSRREEVALGSFSRGYGLLTEEQLAESDTRHWIEVGWGRLPKVVDARGNNCGFWHAIRHWLSRRVALLPTRVSQTANSSSLRRFG